MDWAHYNLQKKWRHAAALVFGQRVRVQTDQVEFCYHSYYEGDEFRCAIAVWPVGDAVGAKGRTTRPIRAPWSEFHFAQAATALMCVLIQALRS